MMIAIIIMVGLVGAMVILANPFAGLLAVVALTPQALLPKLAGTFGGFAALTPIKIVGLLAGMSAFFHHMSKGKKLNALREPTLVFYMWFLVYAVINGFAMPSSGTRENFTFFISICIMAFMVLSLVNSQKRVRIVLWTFLLSLSLVSVQSIINYKSLVALGDPSARMGGNTFGPNEFAISLLPFISVAFYTIGAEKNKLLKLLAAGVFALLLGALALTQSRGALIAFGVMSLLAVFTSKNKFVGILVLVVCLAGVLSFLPDTIWERFQQTKVEESGKMMGRNEAEDSTTRRYYLMLAAWEMYLDHPIFGVGLGNYYWDCPQYYPLSPGRAHSMYLEIGAEMGSIGLFLYFGIVFAFLKALGRLKNAPHPINLQAKSFWIGMTGFFIAAIFLHAQQDKGMWFIFFMTVALERLTRQLKQESPEKKSKKPEGPDKNGYIDVRTKLRPMIFIGFLSLMLFSGSNVFAQEADQFDKFGGWKGLTGTKTGVFHTENINDRWWLITPAGNVFWSTGVYSVRMSGIPEKETNKRPYKDNSLAKHGSEKEWARVTLNRLKEWGFNTVGDWSSSVIYRRTGVVYVAGLDLPRKTKNVIPEGFYGYFPDVFSMEFRNEVVKSMEYKFKQQPYLLDDPWLLGYFLADEPSWYGSKQRHGALVDDFILLDGAQPGKQAWIKFLKVQYTGIDALNNAWNTKYKSFDELLNVKKISTNDVTKEIKLKFLKEIALQFSKTLVESLRLFDKHHMVLGTRPTRHYPEVLEAIGEYSDVFGLSAYNLNSGYKIASNYEEEVSNIYKHGKKPLLVGVIIPGQDTHLPYGRVRTQRDRGVSYWRYIAKIASDSRIVGAHWFQYFDPPLKCYDEQAANWGLVNEKDEPYTDAVELMKQANNMVYSYRLGLNTYKPEFDQMYGLIQDDMPQAELKKVAIPIVNNDFEGRGGWKLQTWKGNSKASYDSWVKHSGKNSLKIKGGANNGWESVGVAVQYNPGITLQPNLQYTFSGWIKVKGVEDFAQIRIKAKDSKGTVHEFVPTNSYGTEEFQYVETKFTPRETLEVEFIAMRLVGGGEAWFDDIKLEVLASDASVVQSQAAQTKAPVINTRTTTLPLENPGFEKGNKGWSFQRWKGRPSIKVDWWVKYKGGKSLLIAGKKAGWESTGVAAQTPEYTLKAGKKYAIQGWIKTQGVEDAAFLRMKLKLKDGGTTYAQTEDAYGDNDWEKKVKIFSLPQDATIEYFVCQLIGGGKAWFDEVSIGEVVGE